MRHFIILLVKTLVYSGVILGGLRFVTNHAYGTSEINQANLNWYVNQKDTIDYLFVGNSYCYSGIHNPLFDTLTHKKSYNLGYATAGPVIISEILSKVDLLRVRNIVWVTTPADITNITDNSEAYPFFLFNNMDDIKCYIKGYCSFNDLVNIFQKRVKAFFYPRQQNLYQKRGSMGEMVSYVHSPKADSAWFTNLLMTQKVNLSKIKLFKKVVQTNSKIILVIYPYKKFGKYFQPDVLNQYNLMNAELARSGVRTIDMNLSANILRPPDWRNFDHLNTLGARKMTKIVADTLNSGKPDYL